MTEINDLPQKIIREHGINVDAEIIGDLREGPCIDAVTNLETRQTILRYNPNFKPNGAERFLRRKNIFSPLEKCVEHSTTHECGHIANKKRQSCPDNKEEYEKYFYEPIGKVLAKKGKVGSLDSVCNLATDLIDNTLIAQGEHSGLTLFYDDVANTIGWDKPFEAYMRIQMKMWGDNEDKELLRKHYNDDKKVIKATQTFLTAIKTDLESKLGTTGLSLSQTAKYLSN